MCAEQAPRSPRYFNGILNGFRVIWGSFRGCLPNSMSSDLMPVPKWKIKLELAPQPQCEFIDFPFSKSAFAFFSMPLVLHVKQISFRDFFFLFFLVREDINVAVKTGIYLRYIKWSMYANSLSKVWSSRNAVFGRSEKWSFCASNPFMKFPNLLECPGGSQRSQMTTNCPQMSVSIYSVDLHSKISRTQSFNWHNLVCWIIPVKMELNLKSGCCFRLFSEANKSLQAKKVLLT